MKKIALSIGLLILIYAIASFKKENTLGELLAKNFDNKIYTEFDTLVYDSVFNKTADSLSKEIVDFKYTKDFYSVKRNFPRFILSFYQNKKLDTLVLFLQQSHKHGLNPELFSTSKIEKLIKELNENKFMNVNESYAALAKAELLIADGYLKYITYLKFGVINPKRLLSNYLIDVKQPDLQFHERVLLSENLTDTLSNVQNNDNKQYKALQAAYAACKNDSIRKILSVNLERLRWDLPQTGEEFVQINIPDFSLVYFKKNDTLINMKVCVGKKIDSDYEKKIKLFEKTGDYNDKPKNYETPILFSSIDMLYTNPVWNIPESIASNEIYEMARKNRFYLKNNHINVYHKNKLIQDPSKIRWSKYERDKLPFLFVQQPGVQNSLGKFKFVFKNNKSIFLHDTDYKKAFKLAYRAISHGCIRLEQPLELAKLLIDNQNAYNKLRYELGLKPIDTASLLFNNNAKQDKKIEDKLVPMIFKAKMPVPLLITYFTAWQKNKKIEYRPDVYGLDEQIWIAMKKFI